MQVGQATAICIALLWTLAAAGGARADCEVRGVASIESLRMRIPGHRIRTLATDDLPIAVRPGHGDLYRDVRVLAPVTFAARTDAEIPWTAPRPELLAGGVLWLTPRAEVEDVREDGEGLVIRAQVDAGVWVSRVHVPCDRIAVGHGESGDPPPSWTTPGAPQWMPRRQQLWLSSRPGGGATVRLDAADGLPLPLLELERRESWVRVATSFSSGSAIQGWVRRRALRPLASGDLSRQPFRRRRVAPGARLCRSGPVDPEEYVGPAHISTGSLVRWRPDGTVWATVSEPAVFTVAWRPGSAWARIVHVPGLRDDGRCPHVLENAWVPRQSVSLQGEGPSEGAFPGLLLGLE